MEDPIPRSHLNYYFIDQDWNRSFYSYYARGKAHATLPVILDSYEAYVNLVCGEGYQSSVFRHPRFLRKSVWSHDLRSLIMRFHFFTFTRLAISFSLSVTGKRTGMGAGRSSHCCCYQRIESGIRFRGPLLFSIRWYFRWLSRFPGKLMHLRWKVLDMILRALSRRLIVISVSDWFPVTGTIADSPVG